MGNAQIAKPDAILCPATSMPKVTISFIQWATVENKNVLMSKVPLKWKQVESTQEDLVELFHILLQKYKRYSYNIKQQYLYCRCLKQRLTLRELWMLI